MRIVQMEEVHGTDSEYAQLRVITWLYVWHTPAVDRELRNRMGIL